MTEEAKPNKSEQPEQEKSALEQEPSTSPEPGMDPASARESATETEPDAGLSASFTLSRPEASAEKDSVEAPTTESTAPEPEQPSIKAEDTVKEPVSKPTPPPLSPPPPATPPVAAKAPKTWPLWLAILVLLAVMGVGAGWFWTYMQTWQAKLDRAMDQSQAGKQLADEVGRRYQDRLDKLDAAVAKQRESQTQLQQMMDQTARNLLSKGETGRIDWLFAEAEYLLRLANQRLHMEKDYVGSLAILQAADQVLAETKEVAAYPVRKALAEEIVSLQAIADIDRQGIYLRLEALINQVENLDQRLFLKDTVMLSDNPVPEEAPTPSGESHWYDSALASMGKLEKYFSIRRLDAPVEPLLAPEQIYYLRQNLRMMLEQAELSLLEKNQDVYVHSLEKAEKWVADYFVINNASAKALLENLQQLKKEPIDPELPDISTSLRMLKNLMESLYKRGGKPATGALTLDHKELAS
ncbi:uroporphyrinogen-III C-methyltransferase [Hahella sp. HN01]|uniref:uroporphyrinogen-III C-methyltransferase n=1 Tax=Hahella sp. HN01 TaxID=2847262 RepID=UPI001C1EE416|nr:uroporphyrinogen-III C-methyltransferase [Hahella sp. HN01]